MSTHRRLKRSDLFLVRVWAEESEDNNGNTVCHGKVQRVVDGESHQFNDWQGFIDLMLAMLAGPGRTGSHDIRQSEQ